MRYLVLLITIIAGDQLSAQTKIWKDSLTDATIYLEISASDYKDHKHRTSKAFEIIETQDQYHNDILKVVNRAFRKYPPSLLKENVEKVYIYDQIRKGNGTRGEYIGRHGFFFAVPYIEDQIDTLDLERLLHHEISHRLYIFHIKKFDKKAWINNNTLKYGVSYRSGLKILEFDAALYEKGFIYSYALTNNLEDFASFAENIFIYQAPFWEALESHDRLKQKFDIICDFYKSLDPYFSKEQFLQFNKSRH